MKHETGMEIFISGKVVKGEGYGRKLGFPTANIDRRQFSRLKTKPKLGVWAGTASCQLAAVSLQLFKAGIVIGPIDAKRLPKIEAHLIGYKGNLYGKNIELKLIKYIRPFKKYKGEAELKSQITIDINKVKKIIK